MAETSKKMQIVFASAECAPFVKTGGLGDVAGSLPAALVRAGAEVIVMVPKYATIKDEYKAQMEHFADFYVSLGLRNEYCGLEKLEHDGVTYMFIDNERYFARDYPYGFFDDGERFAFFSKAITESLQHLPAGFECDILHCNDWQTALVPIYYSLFYANNDWYQGIKTLFTIHNIQYQGKYGMELLEDVLGLPEYDTSIVEFDGCVNLMKGAIETANRVSTVSPTYAQEILDPWFSHGLDPILKERQWKLSGILNGIDVENYNPETDPNLYANYSADDLSGKAENKRALQERLGLEQNPEIPLIGMVTRLVSHKGLDLVKEAMDQLMREENVQFVVLGSGDWEYESFFKSMQEKYPGRFCACFGFVPELSRKIYAGADMFLMPSKSEPCGLSQMIALRYGTVPIVRETGGLKDSISDSGDGKGNGFTFQTYDSQDMLGAVRRAIAGYWNEEGGWKVLMKRAMECDNSWGKSANEYIRLYRAMLKE